jgi:membrane glycosyltransferase
VDPLVNAMACSSGVARLRPSTDEEARSALVAHALAGGPEALTSRDRHALLRDPDALSRLHLAVWSSPEGLPWRAPLARKPGAVSAEAAARDIEGGALVEELPAALQGSGARP